MAETLNPKYAGEKINGDGSITIPLQFPFVDPTGAQISTITLHRMKQKDMKLLRKQFKSDDEAFGDAILAKAAVMTEEDIGELDMEDFAYIQTRFSSMVGIGSI